MLKVALMPAPPIQSLTLTDFRSYAAASLDLSGGSVFLFGPNGAGKTNVLEAVSWLAPGRGLRGAPALEAGRRMPGETVGRAWAVAAAVQLPADGEGAARDRHGLGNQGGGRTDQNIAARRAQRSLERGQLAKAGSQAVHLPVSGHQLTHLGYFLFGQNA